MSLDLFQQICQNSRLGEPKSEPRRLSGGLLHEMYVLETTRGTYAVKLLNPNIMRRPEAMGNFQAAETFAHEVSARLDVSVAQIVDDTIVQHVGPQSYLIFDWVAGAMLREEDIAPSHCLAIGRALGRIHETGTSTAISFPMPPLETTRTDWRRLWEDGMAIQAGWTDALGSLLPELERMGDEAFRATKQLAAGHLISHRDLDPKNVLWVEDGPIVIDWESAGWIHPMQDLIETAVYWSKDEAGILDEVRWSSVLTGYIDTNQMGHVDWDIVLKASFLGRLQWLAYNVGRAVGNESEAERALGLTQVSETCADVVLHVARCNQMSVWLSRRIASSNDTVGT